MRAVANSIIKCSEIVTIKRFFFSITTLNDETSNNFCTICGQIPFSNNQINPNQSFSIIFSFYCSGGTGVLQHLVLWFFFFMYLVVLPTSLHTRCLDTFDYLWLNSKSGHLSFAVCDSIPSYLLCIERVDLNSIADETFNYVVVVENTDSISKPYYSSSYVQDYFPRLTRRHDDETRSEAFDDFGGERERERGKGGHLSKSVKSPQIALEGSGWSSF